MSRPWLTRNLIVLSLISLTQDAASELMYPLMPLFVTGVLAAPAIVLGAVEGCAEVAMGISKFLAGKKSDSFGRKPFITTGYGLAAVGKLLVVVASAWPAVLFGRVVDRLGKGIRSAPRDAMITNSVTPAHYARAYGFHRSADTMGAVLGPLIALIGLAAMDGDIRAVMWWALIPAVLSVGLTLFIKEDRTKAERVASAKQTQDAHDHGETYSLPRNFWTTALPFIAIALTNIPDTLLLVRLAQLGTSTTHVVLAYVAFNAVYTLAAYPAGIIAEHVSPHRVYAIGLVAFALTYITLGQISGPSPVMYLVVALYGFFPALTDGIGKAMVSTTVPRVRQGLAQGAFQSLSGFAILGAGLWGGALWNSGAGHGSLPLTVAGTGALIAAVLLFGFGRSPRLTQSAELETTDVD